VPVQEIAIARDFPFGYALVDVAENGYAYRWIQLSNRELIERGYQTAGEIFRRYSTGVADDRAFSWTAPVRP
jgi:hypothetical protein